MYTLTRKTETPAEHFAGQLERFDKGFYAEQIKQYGLDAVVTDDLNHFWNNEFFETSDMAQNAAGTNELILEITYEDLRAAYQRAFV
jgi:hypothetical protein